MTMVLDTSTVGVRQRAQVLADAMAYAVSGAHVRNLCPADALQARLHYRPLGHTAEIVQHDGSAIWMQVKPRRAGQVDLERLSIGLPQTDGGLWLQHGRCAPMHADELVLIDLTAPYDLRFADGGRTALQVDLADVSLKVDQVRAAAGRLTHSPIYSLAREHLRVMARDISTVVTPEVPRVADAVRLSTAAVIHALVVTTSCERDEPYRQALEYTLLPRIVLYARRRLSDQRLDPRSVAAAHGLTLRQLRRVWSPMQMDLEEWITGERLVVARDAMQQTPPAPTAAVSRPPLFGFGSGVEFRRAYRRAFGVSPRQ